MKPVMINNREYKVSDILSYLALIIIAPILILGFLIGIIPIEDLVKLLSLIFITVILQALKY